LTETNPENPDPQTAVIVFVQKAVGDMEDDWHFLEPGYEPVVESNSQRELFIGKITEGQADGEEEFVAMYGTDMWVRVWLGEYDPDAPDEDPEEDEVES